MHSLSLQVPHGGFSVLVVIQLFHSVSSCLYRKDILLVDRGLYIVNERATMAEVFKEFVQQQMKVFSSLRTYNDIFFECFVALASSWIILDTCFQG